jgi:hypothetical protein
MAQSTHPFLRIEILKLQVSNKQIIDLSKVKTEIEIKEKNSSQPCMFYYLFI